MLLMILWHLKNNFAALKQYTKLRGPAGSSQFNKVVPTVLFFAGAIIAAACLQLPPFSNFYLWGNALRAGVAEQEVQLAYTLLSRRSPSATGAALQIDLRTGRYFKWPQYAFWLETMDGNLIQPLYITQKLADNRFEFKAVPKIKNQVFTSDPLDGSDNEPFEFIAEPATSAQRARPESLPVFLHKLVDSALPETKPDGYAGATVQQSFLLSTQAEKPVAETYRVRFEINQSFDFNHYYSSDRFPDDPIYSGNGYSAQPSLIYEAVIDPQSDRRYYPMELVGRGHHSGKDGEIHKDLNNMTTALEIIDRVIIEIDHSANRGETPL